MGGFILDLWQEMRFTLGSLPSKNGCFSTEQLRLAKVIGEIKLKCNQLSFMYG